MEGETTSGFEGFRWKGFGFARLQALGFGLLDLGFGVLSQVLLRVLRHRYHALTLLRERPRGLGSRLLQAIRRRAHRVE